MVKRLYEEEAYMSEEHKVVVTAGRDILGKLAPEFAKYNDDVLFGEVWSDSTLNLKTRSMITVSTLVASGITEWRIKKGNGCHDYSCSFLRRMA